MSDERRPSESAADMFRVILGNTDRDGAAIISHLRRHVPALAGAHVEAAGSGAGQVALKMSLPAGRLDRDGLRQVLDDAGGCMFQVEAVEKI